MIPFSCCAVHQRKLTLPPHPSVGFPPSVSCPWDRGRSPQFFGDRRRVSPVTTDARASLQAEAQKTSVSCR